MRIPTGRLSSFRLGQDRLCGKRERKSGTDAFAAFHPNGAAVLLDDLF